MKCLTDDEVDLLQAQERRRVVDAVVAILRRRAEAGNATFAGSRELIRAAGEVEALLITGVPAGEGMPA